MRRFRSDPLKKDLAPEKLHIRRAGVPQDSKKRAYFGGKKRAHFFRAKKTVHNIYFDLVEKIENTQHANKKKIVK